MTKKIAAIDIGLKRIGVAFCLTSNIITPYNAILRKNRNQAAKEVSDCLKEWDIQLLVVGYPLANDVMQKRIDHFVTLLSFDGTIEFQNENMSSIEAEDKIKGEILHKRDGRIDSIAATIILERYINTINT